MMEEVRIISEASCISCDQNQYYQILQKQHRINDLSFDQKILVCKHCGLGTVEFNESYSDENLSEYYKSVPRTPISYDQLNADDPRVKNAVSRVEFTKEFSKSGKLLEIGFGDGVTLLEFAKYNYEVSGIDISAGYSEAYKYLRDKGITIINEDFFNYTSEEKYDVVTAFLVLEHIKDPFNFLDQISDLLNVDGTLIIEVPNVENYWTFQSETMITFEHVYHYSIETLTSVLNKAGYKLISCLPKGTSYGFSMTASFHRADHTDQKEWKGAGEKTYSLFNKYLDSLERYKGLLKDYLHRIFETKEKVYFFGAGEFFKELVKISEKEIKENTLAIIDETEDKIGTNLFGLSIISLDEVPKDPITVVIASESFTLQIEKKILEKNEYATVKKIYPDVMKFFPPSIDDHERITKKKLRS